MVDVILAKLDSEEKEYRMAPPFGILYLAGALEKAGFSVRLVHELGTQADIESLVELVSKEKPICVGFSTLTGPPLCPTTQVSKAIKDRYPVPLIWGGLHPTMLPRQTLMNDFVDIVAIGEGEQTIVELVEVLSKSGLEGGKLSNVLGIGFKKNSEVIINKPRPFIENLDEYYPAWHLVDIERYFRYGKHFYTDIGSQFWGEKVAAVLTSRGCPWRCGFCYNQIVNKRRFRPLSPQRVIREIEDYKERYGITAIVFEDDNLFTNKDRALEIIRHIGIPWTSSIRANDVARWGDDFVHELSINHCAEIRIGAESGSQGVLDIMEKDITVEQIRTAVRLCLKHKINPSLGFMIGIPGEIWSDVHKTLDLMDELELVSDRVAVNGPCIFTPYPGTPLFDLASEHGYEPPNSLEEWSLRVFTHKQSLAPYVDKRIRYIAYYRRLAKRRDLDRLTFSLPTRVLRQIAKWRWRRRYFRFPIDYTIPDFFLNLLIKVGLTNVYKRSLEVAWKGS